VSAGALTAGRRPSQTLTLLGLVTAALAFALMQTFLIPALADLKASLHTSGEWVTWTVTIYLLTGSVATPLLGRLGDQHGKKRMMMISLAVFLIGSIGAIFAPNVAVLIVCRGIQGVGGAVFPLSFAIIRDQFPPDRIAMPMGIVSAVLGVGGGVGIVLAGVIVDHASWRWLFVMSAIVVAIALLLIGWFVPESDVRAPAKLDIPGALLLSGGLIALLVALTEGENRGWGSAVIVGLFAVAGAALVAWVIVERRTQYPLVDMRMMTRRPVFFTNLTALISGFALYMTWVLIPTFFETPHGLPAAVADRVNYGFDTTVTGAGLWILPTSAAVLVGGPIAGLIGRRIGSRAPLTAGMVFLAVGLALIASFHDTPEQVALSFTLCGFGIGFAFAAMPRLIVDAVDITETGVATGMNTVVRTLGGVMGAQIGAVILAAQTIPGTSVPSEAGYERAFWVSTVAAVIGVAAAALVMPLRARRRARALAPATTTD